MPVAVAVEYVHAASLVLDDLPSMDDAARRRGPARRSIASTASPRPSSPRWRCSRARSSSSLRATAALAAARRAHRRRARAAPSAPKAAAPGQAADLAADPAAWPWTISRRSTRARPARSSSRRCAGARSRAERGSAFSARSRSTPATSASPSRSPTTCSTWRAIRDASARTRAATRIAPTSPPCSGAESSHRPRRRAARARRVEAL